jgi:hypothetical protein
MQTNSGTFRPVLADAAAVGSRAQTRVVLCGVARMFASCVRSGTRRVYWPDISIQLEHSMRCETRVFERNA